MELIKITEQNGKRVVSARELHSFLGSKKQFSDWIQHRLKKYGMSEGQDYVTFTPDSEKGRPTIEYALTLDAAKELSMVEGNAKGKQARQYFIECEKVAKAAPANLTRLEILKMAIEAEQKVLFLTEKTEAQTKELIAAAPKVKFVEEVLSSRSVHTTTTIAKELGMSARSLNQILNDRKVQFKHNGGWVLYSGHQNKGYTKTHTYPFMDSHGNTQTSIQTVWTEKGRMFIHSLLNGNLKSA